MSQAQAIAILPLLILTATPIVLMVGVAIRRSHTATAVLSLAGLAAALASLRTAAAAAPMQVTPLLMIDAYSLFYTGLILSGTAAVVLLSWGYFEGRTRRPEEFYILVLVAALGSVVLASANHFISLFLGLELLSVSLYAMIAYLHWRDLPVEAGIKYLILAAASAAFLLFGMALIYTELGTMEFGAMRFDAATNMHPAILLPALALIIVGIGFKLAVVPFHMWTPDVYEGAPAPAAAFIATVSKGAMFALLLRFFYGSGAYGYEPVAVVFAMIAIVSMIAGNVLALLQDNVKRILAYSSIAHLGYLLVAFLAAGDLAPAAITFYLVAYFITMLGAFGVVGALSGPHADAGGLAEYRGLYWRSPVIAALFTAMLLSLAGIPLTAGFVGKFYVVAAGTSRALWALVFVLVVTSAIGLYYYLRIVVALYSRGPETAAAGRPRLAPATGVALAILTFLLVAFGIFPQPLLEMIRNATAGLG
ncbi:MAG TPA: NADH-quinone oxidoreductase subunit N [Bryobacteraceae bacterium]|nr:NADH-quinone oxidoreductase subunit N [Bryobacteraceae bacterium]